MLVPGETAEAAMARLVSLVGLTGVAPRRDLLPPADALKEALDRLQDGPATAAQLTAEMPPALAWRTHRALAWMLKLDLIRSG